MSSTPPDLQALQARLEQLEALELARRTAKARFQRVAMVVAALTTFVGGFTWAANGNCPNALPFCFQPDQPALASQVNTNFVQEKDWLEMKVGGVADAGIQASTITSSALTSTTISGTNLTATNLTATNLSGTTATVATINGTTLNVAGTVVKLDSTGVSGSGRLCVTATACAEESAFACGGLGVCSAGKVMVGYRDGTGCGANSTVYCCKLVLTTPCP